MNCPCDKLFELYDEMLDLHIGTKTVDVVFHETSKGFYETLFEVFHGISEAMQDSKQAAPVDCMTAKKRSYEILEEAKGLVESMVNENKDIAVDNVLRGLVDKLGFDCGTARGFSDGKEEEPKKEESKEDTDEEKSEDESEEVEKEDSPEEDVEEDLMSSQMEKDSGYTYGSKEEDKKNPSKEDELNKKRKGSTEYTVVSIMP